ncbi:MAG: 50S ribosomal protein L29 [Candidatus Brocadiia bacterium]
MRASELRGRDREDIERELRNLQEELFNLKFQWQAEENPDTSRRKRLRRDIARCKTVLREMKLQGAAEAATE